MENPDPSTPSLRSGLSTIRNLERAVSQVEAAMRRLLTAWERMWAAFRLPEWPLSDEPAGLDTWEGEGGFIPGETDSGRELSLVYDTTPLSIYNPYHPGCAGCQSCFAEMIDPDDDDGAPDACTRYPECDTGDENSTCTWPSCNEG